MDRRDVSPGVYSFLKKEEVAKMSREKVGMTLVLATIFFFALLLDAGAVRPGPPPHRQRGVKRPPPRHHVVPVPVPIRPPLPFPGFIWVPRVQVSEGILVGGYHRPPAKPGFVWREGYWNDEGGWVDSCWMPVESRPGHIWVAGYWNGSVWIDGFWRVAFRDGFVWLEGHHNRHGHPEPGRWQKR